jgi:anhydro-N-acetylmuramic acid kinase
MTKLSLKPDDITVIGYDGQTVYQEPPDRARMSELPATARPFEKWTTGGYPCGLQIGEPGVVAVLADVPTVTQFRSVDHALGGAGAPLMQFLDYVYEPLLSQIAYGMGSPLLRN